jgi:hypothetical protein
VGGVPSGSHLAAQRYTCVTSFAHRVGRRPYRLGDPRNGHRRVHQARQHSVAAHAVAGIGVGDTGSKPVHSRLGNFVGHLIAAGE